MRELLMAILSFDAGIVIGWIIIADYFAIKWIWEEVIG